ncbi:MAG: DUF433 domain-containing protein [Bryobacteraceae bacterium]|jgi:uncharacterized protein (DUF433 family)
MREAPILGNEGPRLALRRKVARDGKMPMERITIAPGDMGGQPCIRDLQIKFWDVYRDLAFRGMTADSVLQRYPQLEREDLSAVREYAVHLIQSRTHDEFTGRPILSKEALKEGHYYKGRCRNATTARWNAQENCFYYWQEKFGRIFIETIRFPTDAEEAWWDVFDVVEELPNPKVEIPFDKEAVFCGNPDELYEYNIEMWSRPRPKG